MGVRTATAVGLLLLGLPWLAHADEPERRTPAPREPSEAIEACASKRAGQLCTIDTFNGQVTGRCVAPAKGAAPLSCRPERPSRRG